MGPYRENSKPSWRVCYRWRLEPLVQDIENVSGTLKGWAPILIGYHYWPTERTFDSEADAVKFKESLDAIHDFDACAVIEEIRVWLGR
jgi:hypothetical protein